MKLLIDLVTLIVQNAMLAKKHPKTLAIVPSMEYACCLQQWLIILKSIKIRLKDPLILKLAAKSRPRISKTADNKAAKRDGHL